MSSPVLLLFALLAFLTLLLWGRLRLRRPAPPPTRQPPPAPPPRPLPNTYADNARLAGGQGRRRMAPPRWRRLVDVLRQQDKLVGALAASEAFAYAYPAEFNSYDRRVQASLYLQTLALPQAVAAYTALLAAPEPYLPAYNNRGYAHLLLEEYALAVPDFDQAIALDAARGFAYNNRGLARLRLGQPAEALADLLIGLEMEPLNAYSHRNLGIYHYEQGDLPAALASLEQAWQLGPTTPDLDWYLREVRRQLR